MRNGELQTIHCQGMPLLISPEVMEMLALEDGATVNPRTALTAMALMMAGVRARADANPHMPADVRLAVNRSADEVESRLALLRVEQDCPR